MGHEERIQKEQARLRGDVGRSSRRNRIVRDRKRERERVRRTLGQEGRLPGCAALPRYNGDPTLS